jgi:hypothetical protein
MLAPGRERPLRWKDVIGAFPAFDASLVRCNALMYAPLAVEARHKPRRRKKLSYLKVLRPSTGKPQDGRGVL